MACVYIVTTLFLFLHLPLHIVTDSGCLGYGFSHTLRVTGSDLAGFLIGVHNLFDVFVTGLVR